MIIGMFRRAKTYISLGKRLIDRLRIIIMISSFYQRLKKFGWLGKNTKVIVNGLEFELPDTVSFYILLSEKEVERLLRKRVKKGCVFVDVGAHIGKYSILVATMCKKVYAVEPNSLALKYLRYNVRINGLNNVKILNFAAWDKNTQLELFYPGGSGGVNLFKRGKLIQKVIAKRLDDVIKDKVDIVKIDVEGAEYKVLLGMKGILKRYKPLLIVEIQNENKKKVFELLKRYSYKGKKLWKGIGQEYWVFEAKK